MTWNTQVAVVTGAARGIGRACARLLAKRGAAVCVNYTRNQDAAQSLVAEIEGAGGRAIAHAADVAVEKAVEAMMARVEEELGALTILVNNAGVSWQGTLETYDRVQVARMRAVNVEGPIHTIRAAMTRMGARHYGRIINISSIAAMGTSLPGNAFYAAAKAELIILTRRFAMELGGRGITVNAVAPGFVKSDMTQGTRSEAEWQTVAQKLAALSMLGRIGDPEDIANAVAFLADPASGWITAQTLTVDGGRMDYVGHG